MNPLHVDDVDDDPDDDAGFYEEDDEDEDDEEEDEDDEEVETWQVSVWIRPAKFRSILDFGQ